jgi:hypothetical protein
MIEKLEEYLANEGWDREIAEEISNAYKSGNLRLYVMQKLNDDSNDFFQQITSEISDYYLQRNGKTKGVWICKDNLFVIRH